MELGAHHAKKVDTRHLQATDPGAIPLAVSLLMSGCAVVFPTDTVYGVGVIPFDAEALERLFLVKRRPYHKGLPILLADVADIQRVAARVSQVANALIERFWPGPLTLIVPKRADLPAIISPNEGIAVRIPDNDVARSLIRAAGGALATSSANLSGRPPAQSSQEALAQLGGLVAAVLDAGPCALRMPSTIVDCRGEVPLVLREGPILAADLAFAGVMDS